jgi:hypothetical protein
VAASVFWVCVRVCAYVCQVSWRLKETAQSDVETTAPRSGRSDDDNSEEGKKVSDAAVTEP